MKKTKIPIIRNVTKEQFRQSGSPGFSVLRQHVSDSESDGTELHKHDFHELVIVMSGSGYHITQTGKFKVSRGHVFLTLPGVAHGTQRSTLDAVIFFFYPDRTGFSFAPLEETEAFQTFFRTVPHLSDSFRFKNNFTLDTETLETVSGIIKQIELEQKLRQTGWIFESNALFMRLIITLLRSIFKNDSDEYREMLRMNEILRFIGTNWANGLYPAMLADQFGMSSRGMERLFRKLLDTTPVKYINEQKLFKTQELLINSGSSITEIAAKGGFTDNAYFTKCFTAKFGLSPRDYRKKMKSLEISGQNIEKAMNTERLE